MQIDVPKRPDDHSEKKESDHVELLTNWLEWAWHEGNDARNGRRIWGWLYRYDRRTLARAFESREAMQFPFR